MKYLGYANVWETTPQEVLDSKAKGHKVVETEVDKNTFMYTCEEGGWYYKTNCSD